ncbi:MAG TPA: transposase family protein [Sporichthyaceae bacterium]|jgi:transposase|nr:transposase family protein [Sporichthyaceae bacterium]
MRYQSTTGLDCEQITELVVRVHDALGAHPKAMGRTPVLGLYRQVVLVLILMRQNLTQTVAGEMFGVSQATVSRTWRRLRPVLEQVTVRHRPPVTEAFTGRTVLVDGTDVPTGNRAGQDRNYAGKRHRQGLGVQIAADLGGMLLAVSGTVPGACHDRRAISEVGWEELLGATTWIADPAYQGTSAITPTKRRPGMELSEDRAANNAVISGLRSAVERAIAHLKNWKMLAKGYRGLLDELPDVITTIGNLEFYRLGW